MRIQMYIRGFFCFHSADPPQLERIILCNFLCNFMEGETELLNQACAPLGQQHTLKVNQPPVLDLLTVEVVFALSKEFFPEREQCFNYERGQRWEERRMKALSLPPNSTPMY